LAPGHSSFSSFFSYVLRILFCRQYKMNVSTASLNNSFQEEDEMRLGYNHEHIKTFLGKSSVKHLFPYANHTTDAKQVIGITL